MKPKYCRNSMMIDAVQRKKPLVKFDFCFGA